MESHLQVHARLARGRPLAVFRDGRPEHVHLEEHAVLEDVLRAMPHVLARDQDVILIAGKGHEKYQEIKGVRHDFDDYKIASEYTNQKNN